MAHDAQNARTVSVNVPIVASVHAMVTVMAAPATATEPLKGDATPPTGALIK